MSNLEEVKQLLGGRPEKPCMVSLAWLKEEGNTAYTQNAEAVRDAYEYIKYMEQVELEFAAVAASRDYMEQEMEFYKRLYREKKEGEAMPPYPPGNLPHWSGPMYSEPPADPASDDPMERAVADARAGRMKPLEPSAEHVCSPSCAHDEEPLPKMAGFECSNCGADAMVEKGEYFCPECGAVAEEEGVVCPTCGTRRFTLRGECPACPEKEGE